MDFVLLSPSTVYPNEFSLLLKMFEAGLQQYHIRKEDWDLSETMRFIDGIPPEFQDRLVLHGKPEWYTSLPLQNVHLKEMQTLNYEPKGRVGRSLHFLPDIAMAPDMLDYAFIGPIFSSISKPGYGNAFTPRNIMETLVENKSHSNRNIKKVYALGGVLPENVSIARDMGFDGVVSLGGVWNNVDPVAQCIAFLEECE